MTTFPAPTYVIPDFPAEEELLSNLTTQTSQIEVEREAAEMFSVAEATAEFVLEGENLWIRRSLEQL